MIATLWGYENRTTLPLLGWITATFCAVNLATGGLALLVGGKLGLLLATLSMIVGFGYVPAILVALTYRFYTSCYGKTGYFTAAIPARGAVIFWVKFFYAAVNTLCAFLLSIAMALIGAQTSNQITGTGNVLQDLRDGMQQLTQNAPSYSLILGGALIVLWAGMNAAPLFFAVVVGNQQRLANLGLGGPVVVWLIYYGVAQVFAFIGFALPPTVSVSNKELHLYWESYLLDPSHGGVPVMILVVMILLYLASIIWAKRWYDQKLNLR